MRPSRKILGSIIALFIAVIMILPGFSILNAFSNSTAERSEVTIYFGRENSNKALRNLQVKEWYDSFAIAEITEKQRDLLESKGYIIEDEPFLHTIALNGYVFDTREGEPPISENLRIESYPNGEAGHYIIQFIGPIKEEWKREVSRLGAEIEDYLPHDAFLIKMSEQTRERLNELDFVQWVGLFQPAYKIRPGLLERRGDFEVKIITYEGKGIYSVLSMLDKDSIMRSYEGDDFGVVKARIDASLLPDLAKLDGVRYIEPLYQPRLTNEYMQWIHQTNILGNRKLWDYGIDGSNQVLCFADTGLDYDHRYFRQSAMTISNGDLYNVTDYNRRKVIRYMTMSNYTGVDPWFGGDIWAHRDSGPKFGWETSGHGTMVSSTGAGNDDGIGTGLNDGLAKGAKIYIQDIGTVCQPEPGRPMNDCLRYIPDDYAFLYGPPYADGVRIHSNSWGTHDSTYDLEAMMTDKFMWEHPDMLIVFSNGNGGPSSTDPYDVGSPATAKSIVSAGAAGNARSVTGWDQNDVAGYSSRGPTADGRLKPTITMVGEGRSARSDSNPWSDTNTAMETSWLGTSYAAPAAAGAAAMIRQYFQEGWYPTGRKNPAHSMDPSAALIKAILAVSGQKITGSYRDSKGEQKFPNNSQGWGRPLLDRALYFADAGDTRRLAVVEHKQGLLTGNAVEYKFFVNSGEELKIQLVWTDYPGTIGAQTALVNNLNLNVTAPNGFVYAGNSFSIPFDVSESRPSAIFDPKNPIEGIRLSNPVTGVWRVQVIAKNVPAGPQPFALVVSGDLEPSFGQVFIDKEVYSDRDRINIKVQDLDAASVSVKVSSTTEPAGETVPLAPLGGLPGVFMGSIDTKFETPSTNGTLEVSDGDSILVSYTDLSPIHTSTADAIVDAAPPMISDVFVVDITNAAATITWKTDEPSDSKVYWGRTSSLGNVEYDPTLVVRHSIDLIGLETGRKYYFDVQSSDWFSHTATDTNGGEHYSFTTTERGEILLVIGDSTFPSERVRYYRNDLEWGGWSYNLWYAQRSGDPPLSLLQQYKVVLWQTGLEQYPPLEYSQSVLIQDYLNGGGRFFLSSHDVGWAFASPNSQFSNATNHEFLMSTLKADWKADPYTWSHVEGITGDPISGSYSLGNRIQYKYHRRGASGDEITALQAGGTSSYVWKSYGLEANQDFCSLRWFSSTLNDSAPGDDPNIVWDNTTSKIVVFFFEFTGLDYGKLSSGVRGDVLNKTILWLLNSTYHPVVDISYPNGGETFTGNTVTIYWNRTATPAVAKQAVYYSRDSGQTWFLIDNNLAAGQTSYVWDISSIDNGIGYMVKVVAQDTNTPPLNGSDDSDSTFTILRPGGDSLGPKTVPGSVMASPNPSNNRVDIHFNATVDDSSTGNSMIWEAEFFVQATEPSPAEFGTGYYMNATDGNFDSPTEEVEWQGPVANTSWESVGNYTVWVHGRDDPDGLPSSGDENWGTFYWANFTITYPPPDISVEPPTFVSAVLTGSLYQDVRIIWGLSPDDPAVGGAEDVVRYEIFRGAVYDPSGIGYSYLGQTGPSQTSYLSLGDGDGDLNEYFYYVVAVDANGNRGASHKQGGKFTKYLSKGVNLVSTPFIPYDDTTSVLLQTLDYDRAWTYDSSSEEWKDYDRGKPHRGDFLSSSCEMGIWVNILSDDYFTVAGTVPETTTIELSEGWNLVGYPSLVNRTVEEALTGLSYDMVEGFNAASGPYYLVRLGPTAQMARGEGFWIHMTAADTWTLPQ